MKYIVPKEFLDKYRYLADKYAGHPNSCSSSPRNYISLTDSCDCGYSNLIRDLQELGKEIKEYKE